MTKLECVNWEPSSYNILSTHPSSSDRIQRLETKISGVKELQEKNCVCNAQWKEQQAFSIRASLQNLKRQIELKKVDQKK
jgi:hypothetical protein